MSNLAGVLAKTGQMAEAISTFEAALREDASYPNAWYGIGLALCSAGDREQLYRAVDALDHALQVLGDQRKNPSLWDTTRELLSRVVYATAEASLPVADQINATVAEAEGERGGMPVRREEAQLSGIQAKLEIGWVHGRPFHRLVVHPGAGIEREHYVRHELEHLRLVNLARAARRNRWFVSNTQTREVVTKTIRRDIEALSQKALPPDQLQEFIHRVTDGLLTQVYNTPIDLLIESRLLEAHPELSALVYLSVKAQLELGLRAAEDPQIRRLSPRAIFRANVAMNGAFALWFEERWPRRTDLASRFQRAEVWPQAQRLYTDWRASVADWTPGAEYEWIDNWAEVLGLKGWFAWINGNEEPAARKSSLEPHGSNAPSDAVREVEQMAYMHYMLGALEWLDREGLGRAREVAAEIAGLGTSGIDLGGDRKYTLRTLPGKAFSGRHLVSYLYVCLKALDPTVDPGIDLHEPYLQALELHRRPLSGDK